MIAWGDYKYSSDTDYLPNCLFAWCKSIQKIRFPKYITEISNNAILQCSGISQLSIPPGVTTIKSNILNGGYSDMNLQVLNLPSSLTYIGDIYQCGNLTDIYCLASIPPTIESPGSFKSQSNISNGILYVPKVALKHIGNLKGGEISRTLKSHWIFSTLFTFRSENTALSHTTIITLR